MTSTALSGVSSGSATGTPPKLGANTVVIDLSAQHGKADWKFDASQDVIFIGSVDTPQTALKVDDAHNVIVLGGAFESTGTSGALLAFTNITGDVFVEGVGINARLSKEADGISVLGAPGCAPMLTIENSHIETVAGQRARGPRRRPTVWARRMICGKTKSINPVSGPSGDEKDVGLNFDGLCALAELSGLDLADLAIALAIPSGMISLADVPMLGQDGGALVAEPPDPAPGDPTAVHEMLRFLARDILSGDAAAFSLLDPDRFSVNKLGSAMGGRIYGSDGGNISVVGSRAESFAKPSLTEGGGDDAMKALIDFVRQGKDCDGYLSRPANMSGSKGQSVAMFPTFLR